MLIRGGHMYSYTRKPDHDPMWSPADYSYAATLEARFQSLHISESERQSLIPCAVIKRKWPETTYNRSIELRLQELKCL